MMHMEITQNIYQATKHTQMNNKKANQNMLLTDHNLLLEF